MTDIAFHFNAPDRIGYVCRLLRKAVGVGAKVVVSGPEDVLDALGSALWMLSPTDFIPHCGPDAAGAVLSKSPVVFVTSVQDAPFFDVLVNLGAAVPAGFDRFARLIEVVTLDELDRKEARGRWKAYSDAGFSLIRHDVQKSAS